MYESPIKMICDEIKMHFENKTLNAIQHYDIQVDKDELIKALNYDRSQYEKGYDDAKQKYKRALDKLAGFLEELQIEVPCDSLVSISDVCKICPYNEPVKECWIKWAEKEAEE